MAEHGGDPDLAARKSQKRAKQLWVSVFRADRALGTLPTTLHNDARTLSQEPF